MFRKVAFGSYAWVVLASLYDALPGSVHSNRWHAAGWVSGGGGPRGWCSR